LWFVSWLSCGQALEGRYLIDEINAAKLKARKLGDEAESKRKVAKEKIESGDRAEHDRLIEEAAKLYGQISDTLESASKKASELSKFQTPAWYQEYFGLQSKLIRNLAQLAAGAHNELLSRKSGSPTDAQVQSWKDNIKRIREENEGFRKQIAFIETQQGMVLIKEWSIAAPNALGADSPWAGFLLSCVGEPLERINVRQTGRCGEAIHSRREGSAIVPRFRRCGQRRLHRG
jgi:hypothetical protein